MAWLMVRDRWAGASGAGNGEGGIVFPGFARQLNYRYRVTLPRGVYRSHEVTVLTGDWFGFVTHAVRRESPVEAAACPVPAAVPSPRKRQERGGLPPSCSLRCGKAAWRGHGSTPPAIRFGASTGRRRPEAAA
ncbi:hypothetical protein N6H14_14350 [Paenibacillus sp. CC-CFT747]|nr:hypothetical protein N6H14_14350 [Paenibacillus sp. CC-CFT747]